MNLVCHCCSRRGCGLYSNLRKDAHWRLGIYVGQSSGDVGTLSSRLAFRDAKRHGSLGRTRARTSEETARRTPPFATFLVQSRKRPAEINIAHFAVIFLLRQR